jgi:hypothetical protein
VIRIGGVNIDVSHPKEFSDYLAKGNRARYVAVYNEGFRGDDEVDGFVKSYGLERKCRSIEELADLVDIGFVQACNWQKHLAHAMPFIERKKPVFIDKPIVGCEADCRRIEDLVARGAVILGSSSLRYSQEIVEFMAKPEAERGKIVNAFITVGTDEFNYAIHAVESLGGIMGPGAVSTRWAGASQADGKDCDTYFVRWADGRAAVYHSMKGVWQPNDVVVMTTKTSHHFRIDTSKVYGALLDRICDFMETKKSALAPVKAITESIRIMLAGRLSKERGGAEVRLSDIPATAPGFDGNAFEKGYAAAAKKIYLP